MNQTLNEKLKVLEPNRTHTYVHWFIFKKLADATYYDIIQAIEMKLTEMTNSLL